MQWREERIYGHLWSISVRRLESYTAKLKTYSTSPEPSVVADLVREKDELAHST
eukprot:GABW01002559.1.p1 GENE.GABW01002559.1~~GABW01002559.1.p1  ORF type:complete len:54 (-),score=16.61 GABW01002559.1:3-164(-)